MNLDNEERIGRKDKLVIGIFLLVAIAMATAVALRWLHTGA